MTLLIARQVGESEGAYVDGFDANGIQAGTATQIIWLIAVLRGMILTFIPLWVERYKCDSSFQQFDFSLSWVFLAVRASFPLPAGNVWWRERAIR